MNWQLAESFKTELEVVRMGTPEHSIFTVLSIRSHVRKGSLSLDQINTTEEELTNLLREGCKVKAKKCIPRLRDKDTRPIVFEMLKVYFGLLLLEGDLTLEDVGLSQKAYNKIMRDFDRRILAK